MRTAGIRRHAVRMLAGIGIVKGQPFEPDERTKAIRRLPSR
jgi:hypothetical protein